MIESFYSVGSFELVRMSELGELHFRRHPVWSEFYDFEERQDIVSWGVDSSWLTSALEREDSGDDHWAYTVLRPYPLPDRMRIFLAATITTSAGSALPGFILNMDGDTITFYDQGEEVVLARCVHAMSYLRPHLESWQNRKNLEANAVFPITYATEYRLSDGTFLGGVFDLPPA